jgi:uncharacterized protein (TIGR03435 family)
VTQNVHSRQLFVLTYELRRISLFVSMPDKFAQQVALAVAGIAALVGPGVVGMMYAPLIPAQSAAPVVPKFEVASIKPCRTDIPPNGRSGGGNSSPGRLNVECQTVMGLIQAAYVIFADGHSITSPMHVPISGGPAWINADRYDVNAKPEGPQSEEMMNGPMMQALLEDRLKLKIHRETREIPVYALTVAKGGIKLKPFKEGSCTPIDFTKLTMETLDSRVPGVNYCRNVARLTGGIETYDVQGTSLDEFSIIEFGRMDRPVLNRTGLTGLFDIHLEFAPGATDPDGALGAFDPVGPSIFAALQQQLGLKLEPTKGPREFIVIDHVEKPSEN